MPACLTLVNGVSHLLISGVGMGGGGGGGGGGSPLFLMEPPYFWPHKFFLAKRFIACFVLEIILSPSSSIWMMSILCV